MNNVDKYIDRELKTKAIGNIQDMDDELILADPEEDVIRAILNDTNAEELPRRGSFGDNKYNRHQAI
jgi:hypothetical protein